MGEGLNWTQTDEDGRFNLPKARFRGGNAPPQVPVSLRADGYRPMTRIAESDSAALGDVALEDGAATEWKVSLCTEPGNTPTTIGFEMQFTLPQNVAPSSYGDIDYSGRIIQFDAGGKASLLRTMNGAVCCGGHPYRDRYLNSTTVTERAWIVRVGKRKFDGLDSRGVAKDGTRWRWVGPLLGEQAEYSGANEQAAKFFDSILDTLCIRPRF
jgi:hypothetical protein